VCWLSIDCGYTAYRFKVISFRNPGTPVQGWKPGKFRTQSDMSQIIRTARLRRVFNGDEKRRQFDAKLARVCVLFEDLRIEIRGVTERSLPALDILDPEKDNWLSPEQTGKYRKFYFLRRSLATLRDFGEALSLIIEDTDNDPSLRLTFSELTDQAPDAWVAAIDFFDGNKAFLQGIRNDIGGHFGHKAALNALSMFQPDAGGSIALSFQDRHSADAADEDWKQLRLHFAAEIAGTALLKYLPKSDIAEYGTFLRNVLLPGYRHAINCVYILVREYLWDRFRS
jgi:hypothetical protein